MADTLLSLIKRVLRATGQNPSKTGFSDGDDTQYLVDRVNDGIQQIYRMNPTQIDVESSVTLPVSTRVVNGPMGLDIYRIYDWSFRINKASGDVPLKFVTKEFIVTEFPLFESEEADYPVFVYLEGNQLGFFPLIRSTASSLTIQFSYPSMASRLTAAADTFVFPDNSDELFFVEKYAQSKYELFKGIGQPLSTLDDLSSITARLVGKYARGKKLGFKPYRNAR